MSEATFDTIIEIISSLSGAAKESITEETTLLEELQLDSLKFVELMAIIGEEYDVVIQEQDSVNLQSVGQLFDYIKHNQAA